MSNSAKMSARQTNACTINQTDHRRPGLYSHLVKSGDLFCVHLANGTIHRRHVLAVHIHQVGVDHGGAVVGGLPYGTSTGIEVREM